MLPRLYRLPSSQFPIVKSQSQLLQTPLFGLLVFSTPRRSSAGSRFGFIVSTKISLKAVVRNRIRRLLSEALLPLLPRLQPDHDYLVLAKPKLIGQPLLIIRQTFDEVFTAHHLYS